MQPTEVSSTGELGDLKEEDQIYLLALIEAKKRRQRLSRGFKLLDVSVEGKKVRNLKEDISIFLCITVAQPERWLQPSLYQIT